MKTNMHKSNWSDNEYYPCLYIIGGPDYLKVHNKKYYFHNKILFLVSHAGYKGRDIAEKIQNLHLRVM